MEFPIPGVHVGNNDVIMLDVNDNFIFCCGLVVISKKVERLFVPAIMLEDIETEFVKEAASFKSFASIDDIDSTSSYSSRPFELTDYLHYT